jgi:bifunctional non-homologous end joining protein LigD
VESCAEGTPLAFEADEVLDRLEDHGDLFAETLTLRQRLPDPQG